MQSVVRHVQITIILASRDGPAYITIAYHWKHIAGLELADHDPMSSDPIDIIIGADSACSFSKRFRTSAYYESTTLGWILSGPIASFPTTESISVLALSSRSRSSLFLRNWGNASESSELWGAPVRRALPSHIPVYRKDTISSDYRLKPPISISESRSIAISSFRRLEQRLIRVPINAFENREFFAEYEILNHMIKSPSKLSTEIVKANLLFPYHAVLRDSSAITFLRVVFNASCRTSNGTSLSDSLTTLNFRGI